MRVKNGTASLSEMDVMICDAEQCDFCGTYNSEATKSLHRIDQQAQAAEHNIAVPAPEESPYQGLPFVHGVRDLRNAVPSQPGIKSRIFTPAGPTIGLQGDLATKAVVVFDDTYNLVEEAALASVVR